MRPVQRRAADGAALKPGPPSLSDLQARLDHALRYREDRLELNRNPLTRLASVATLAQARYVGRIHPRALALRELLDRAVDDVLADVAGEDGLQQVREFLALYRAGRSVSEAARQLGRSREHTSRYVKRRALELLAVRFAALALERRQPLQSPVRPAVLRAS